MLLDGLLINASDLLAASSSELCNSIQATYEPGNQPPLEIPMKDLASWLGKYMGMTYIHEAHLEGYAKCALTKVAYNNAAHIGEHHDQVQRPP